MSNQKTKAEKRVFAEAEDLSDLILNLCGSYIPPEDLTTWIRVRIRLTEEEASEEAELLEKEVQREAKEEFKQRKSTFDELREVLGMPELTLLGAIKAAIVELRKGRR